MSHNPFTPRQRARKQASQALANARVAERLYKKARNAHERRYYRVTYEDEVAAALIYRDKAHGRDSNRLDCRRYDQGAAAGRKLATKVRRSR